jgi:hypothetical protein
MVNVRDPRFNDLMPPSDVTWVPIKQIGVPSAFGHFQFTWDGSILASDDVRRDPDNMPPTVVSRWHERPY